MNARIVAAVSLFTLLGLAAWLHLLSSGQGSTPETNAGAETPASVAASMTREEEREAITALPVVERRAATPTASPAGVRDRFVGLESIAEEGEPLPDGRWLQTRLVRHQGRLVRVENTWTDDPEGGGALWKQVAMSADRILIEVPPESVASFEEWTTAAGLRISDNNPRNDLRAVVAPEVELSTVPDLLAEWEETGIASISAPDHLQFTMTLPNDTRYGDLWGLQRINAEQAWVEETGESSVVVAVIDSGIDIGHPDLDGNLWNNPGEIPGNSIDDDGNGYIDDIWGWDFFSNDGWPGDSDGHGTHVSGTIGAEGNNGRDVVGVNWDISLITARTGESETLVTEAIIDSLDYLADLKEVRGIPLVATNNSWGSSGSNPALLQAIVRQRNAGIVFVAAAGNDGENNDAQPTYPANYSLSNIISVASTDQADNLSSFSNFGALSVDLAAPGSGIRSTLPGGTTGLLSGTSMATPHVTGAVALVAAANPGISMDDLIRAILDGVDPLPSLSGRMVTGGRLNLASSLSMADALPTVQIDSPATELVRLTEPGGIRVTSRLLDQDGIEVTDPIGTVEWTSIPTAGVTIEGSNTTEPTVFFSAEGEYRIQVEYAEGVRVNRSEFTVKVGTGALVSSGLLAHWTMDVIANGNLLIDSSGNGRNGTISGAVPVPGKVGQALRFDGIDDRVQVTAASSPVVTFSAWVRPEGPGTSIFPRIFNGPEYLFFFGRAGQDEPPNYNTVKFFVEKSFQAGVWYGPSGLVVDNAWQHVAVTYNGLQAGSTPDLYYNGRPIGVAAQVAASGSRVPGAGTAFLGEAGDGSRPWEGLIDDLRVYNRELSAAEIASLAAEPSSVTAPTLSIIEVDTALASETKTLTAQTNSEAEEVVWEIVSAPVPTLDALVGPLTRDFVFPEAGEYTVEAVLTTDEGVTLVAREEITVLERNWANWLGFYLSGESYTSDLQAEADDFDGDRVSNLLEFALGTNPLVGATTPTAQPVLQPFLETRDDRSHFGVWYRRAKVAPDVTLTVEYYRTDGTGWIPVSSEDVDESVLSLSDAREEVRLVEDEPVSGTVGLYRLSVSREGAGAF